MSNNSKIVGFLVLVAALFYLNSDFNSDSNVAGIGFIGDNEGYYASEDSSNLSLGEAQNHWFSVGKEGLTFEDLEESGIADIGGYGVGAYVFSWDTDGYDRPDSNDRSDATYYYLYGNWRKVGSWSTIDSDTRVGNYFVIRAIKNKPINLDLPTHVNYYGATSYSSTERPWDSVFIAELDNFPTIQAELINSEVAQKDSGQNASFFAEFELTAGGGDVFIPRGTNFVYSEKGSKIEPGVNLFVTNNGTLMGEDDIQAVAQITSSADTKSGFYVIKKGDTESFNLTVNISDVQKSGVYSVALKAFSYSNSLSAKSTNSREHDFGFNSRFVSESVFIEGSVIVNPEVSVCNLTRDLTVGSTGSDVVALQNFLEREGYFVMPDGVAKGYFGSLLESALADYQNDKKITVFSYLYGKRDNTPTETGYLGYLTRAYLEYSCDKG